jgi:hypothetical protein
VYGLTVLLRFSFEISDKMLGWGCGHGIAQSMQISDENATLFACFELKERRKSIHEILPIFRKEFDIM